MLLLTLLIGLVTGFILGLLGSGGAIITVPALIYLLGVLPKSAITMSFGIIGVTATISSVTHWRHNNVSLSTAAIFGIFGAGGTYVGTRIGIDIPVPIQMTLFAIAMYTAAYLMVKPILTKLLSIDLQMRSTVMRSFIVAVVGASVGALTGMIGVGGGFLIVPALVSFAGLPVKLAIGTSLVIISINSLAGFTSYISTIAIDYSLFTTFTIVTIIGSFVGAVVSQRVSSNNLKDSFFVLLVAVATYILVRELVLLDYQAM